MSSKAKSQTQLTDVYRIDEDSEIRFYASYSLEASHAVHAAFQQSHGNFNTWDYERLYLKHREDGTLARGIFGYTLMEFWAEDNIARNRTATL